MMLLVDDHALVLQGIAAVFRENGYDGQVLTAANVAGALLLLQTEAVDVVVVDLELPDGDGFSLIGQARSLHPALRVIVLTMHEELWTVKRLLKADVDAIVLKGDNLQEVVRALRETTGGHRYFSQRFLSIAKRVFEVDDVTPRECEVLRCISQGLTSAEAADRLFVSENTIEFHRRQLMRKLKAANVAEMVSKAIALGLLLR